MDDQTLSSVYSFTSYNTLHYSDITNRLHQKVNSYAIEINQKVKDDNQSLNDMEEGIIALSNYLNGVEEKRPSVSELIGSRINLDDCLKLKLEIREKIRKTKKIRTDLFTSSIESPHSGPKNKPDVKFDVRLTPQTSRNVSPRNYGQPESELQVHLKQPKLRPKPIETSKSFSSLPSSTPTSIRSAKAISAVEPIAPVRIDPPKNLSPSNEAIQEKRISQSNDILATPVIKPPLITPLIPTSSQKQRSLAPIDDLADRQLAWLLNIEAKNRQTRQALEAQSIREVEYFY